MIKKVYDFLWKFKIELAVAVVFLTSATLLATQLVEKTADLTYDDFMVAVEQDQVDHIVNVKVDDTIKVVYKDGTSYRMMKLGNDEFYKDIQEAGVTDIRTQATTLTNLSVSITTLLITFILIYVILKYFTVVAGNLKVVDTDEENAIKSTVRFDDVAGMSGEKQELQTAITSLVEGKTLEAKGMRPVRGVLLEGPPGVGKTLLAKAVAGEAGVKFLSYSGSSFSSSFVAIGSMKVRAMYKKAIESRPCVVFIDEIDSVGAARSGKDDSGSRESNNILNTLLEVMDGISTESGVLFIGATNLSSHLDPALLRPGRFDKIIHIGPPNNKEDREAIVRVHLRNKQIAEGTTVEGISKLCFGLTGAQIEGVLNESVMESILDGKEGIIHLEHVDKAVMKSLTRGVAKPVHANASDLERVAIHEMGHALMNLHLNRRVIKVSVQPYSSGVGGVTMVDNESNGSHSFRSKEDLIGDVKVLYAGMVAEEVVLGDISTGNSNDLERATEILDRMVSSWGMDKGNLLSTDYLNKKYMPLQQEKGLARLETLSSSIYQEVKHYFSQPEVKATLIAQAKELESKEVIHDLEPPTKQAEVKQRVL